MVRTTFIKGKEYCAISTSMEVGNSKAPMQAYIDVTGLDVTTKRLIYRHASLLLDHVLKIDPPKTKIKPWYQFW